MHGARSPGAPIKTGRYSKHLGRLARAYEESLSDAGLLDMRESVAVLDVHVKRCATRASELDTPDFRARCRVLHGQAKFDELGKLLEQGANEDDALRDLVRAVETFSRNQAATWGVKLAKGQAVNAKTAMAAYVRLLDIFGTVAGADAKQKAAAMFSADLAAAGRN